jgi:hypothetical protein
MAHSKSVEGVQIKRDVSKKFAITKSFDNLNTKMLMAKPKSVLKQSTGRFDLPLQRSSLGRLRNKNTTPTPINVPFGLQILQRTNDTIRTSKDGGASLHPYLKDTIRPLNTIQRSLSD